uniref:Uncharacterized protein n=1 Tax=viral metagenome TaxID=1070528 RepID=A0A6C0J2N7_9ZZZZ
MFIYESLLLLFKEIELTPHHKSPPPRAQSVLCVAHEVAMLYGEVWMNIVICLKK